jgi:subtilisin family serine protease
VQTVRRALAIGAAAAGVAGVLLPASAVAARLTNDPLVGLQRHLTASQVPAAWKLTTGGPVVAAVIDSGVELGHRDLAGNIWTNIDEIARNGIDDDHNGYVDDRNGYDFVDGDPDPGDELGHGTMVAGILGARGNNHRGITGVAQRVQIMSLRVLDRRGIGTVYTVAQAIRYAAANGARVANVSVTPAENPGDLQDAIEFARTRGMLVVVLAGNSGLDLAEHPLYPACSPSINVVTVGATDDKGQLVPFSNRGTCVDVAAPGVGIVGTARGGGYGRNTGTSFAAPQVAGAAVLALARRPDLRVEQLATMFRARPLVHAAAHTSPIARLDVGAIVRAVR